jgi:hypothetical protein
LGKDEVILGVYESLILEEDFSPAGQQLSVVLREYFELTKSVIVNVG